MQYSRVICCSPYPYFWIAELPLMLAFSINQSINQSINIPVDKDEMRVALTMYGVG
jgi:hypothetical protein